MEWKNELKIIEFLNLEEKIKSINYSLNFNFIIQIIWNLSCLSNLALLNCIILVQPTLIKLYTCNGHSLCYSVNDSTFPVLFCKWCYNVNGCAAVYRIAQGMPFTEWHSLCYSAIYRIAQGMCPLWLLAGSCCQLHGGPNLVHGSLSTPTPRQRREVWSKRTSTGAGGISDLDRDNGFISTAFNWKREVRR